MSENMLELPEWFKGGYTDAEALVMGFLQWLLGDRVYVCSWLPQGHYTLTPGEPVGGTQPTLRVWRQPGKSDPDLKRDQALVQIAAITPTRQESWDLVAFLRMMMDDDVCVGIPIDMGDGETRAIYGCTEWVGPQIVPERLVDEKFIPVTFKVTTRLPEGTPDYRRILKSLL